MDAGVIHKFDVMIGGSSACEDLKAFERRLTEVVCSYQPAARKWRSKFVLREKDWYLDENFLFLVILLIIASATAIGAYYWLKDPDTSIVPFRESLLNHKIFSLAIVSLSKFRFSFPQVQRADLLIYIWLIVCFVLWWREVPWRSS